MDWKAVKAPTQTLVVKICKKKFAKKLLLSETGLSLLEILVTVALLTLIIVIAPFKRAKSPRDELDRIAQRIEIVVQFAPRRIGPNCSTN